MNSWSSMRRVLSGALAALLCHSASAELPEPYLQQLIDSGTYDESLCTVAQLTILNAQPEDFDIVTLEAQGGTFVTEQMDTNRDAHSVTVAKLLETVKMGRRDIAVTIACKQVNQNRVNDILQLDLPPPAGSCRDVNELTYALALNRLSDAQRQRFLDAGTTIAFSEDYEAVAGGEWLPSVVNDFMTVANQAGQRQIVVAAPSVQVPWPGPDGDWFEGTHHCKLITLKAMSNWMKRGAFENADELFPRPRPACEEPSSRTSTAGSCLLYFGPAGAQFCQDYSGAGWTTESAAADCAIRHSSQTSWDSSGDQYSGDGGVYSELSCVDRDAVAAVRAEPFGIVDSANRGTCVFRCNTQDEALWHQLSAMPADPDGRMMERNLRPVSCESTGNRWLA